MALIPGFKHDIFISYVHDNNKSEKLGDIGWVDKFHHYLLNKLIQHKKDWNIWWDKKRLNRGEVFDKSIFDAIEKSAIMICLYSSRYPDSDYCLEELKFFYDKIQKDKSGPDVNNRARIIPVLINNINYKEWLPEFKDENLNSSGFDFYEAPNEESIGDPLDQDEPKYAELMIELRDNLVSIYDAFAKMENKPSQGKPVSDKKSSSSSKKNSDFTIYMAEVVDSIRDRRDGIINELKENGYNIIIGDDFCSDNKTHEEETLKAIKQSQLSVHILNEVPGRKITDAPDYRYIQQQVEIGLTTDTPKLIWIPSHLKIDKIQIAEYLDFMKALEDKKLPSKDYDWVRGNEAELGHLINETIRQITENDKNETSDDRDGQNIRVLLDTRAKDYIQAYDIVKILREQNIEPVMSAEDGSPSETMSSIYDNIKKVDEFVFLCGHPESKEWVDVRVGNTLKKLIDYKRFNQDIIIYSTLSPEERDSIAIAGHDKVNVIDKSDLLLEKLTDKSE